MRKVKVTIVIALDESGGDVAETKFFEMEGGTEGDLFDLVDALLGAANCEAGRWVTRTGTERRRGVI